MHVRVCVCAEKMQNLAESLSRSAAEQQVSVSMQSSRDVPRSTSEGGPWQSAGSSPAAAAADGLRKVALIFCAEVSQTEPALAGNEPAPAGSEQPKPPSAKALDGFHPIAEDRMPPQCRVGMLDPFEPLEDRDACGDPGLEGYHSPVSTVQPL